MRKLVFNFYITKDWRENLVYTVHFNCLKHYKECFDEAYFAISCEDETDYTSIVEVEQRLLSIFSPLQKVTFEIVKNDPIYCEVATFKREVVDKLGEDNLVFFGHLKGVMDVKNGNPEDVYRVLCGLYYLSLEQEKNGKEITNCLIKDVGYMSYGSFLTRFSSEINLHNKYKWYYGGTFFWINSRRLKNYIKSNAIELPEYSDRFYAENFLGYIYPVYAFNDSCDTLALSYGGKYWINYTPVHVNFSDQMSYLLKDQEEMFNNFVEEMKKV